MARMRFVPVVAVLLAMSARADGIYTYTQRDGTVVYTNVPPAGVHAKKVRGTFRPAPKATEPAAPVLVTRGLYQDWMTDASRKYRIPLALVRAVMHAESNNDQHAVSRRGASGLMQLMPDTAQEMYVKDIFDAKQNIYGGVRYLRVLANQFDGQMEKMIAAYNAGPEAVRRHDGNVPPYDETQAYVRKVLTLYYQYKQEDRGAVAWQ